MPGGLNVDPSSIIVALSGAVATAWGIRQSLRGQKTEKAQKDAANELAQKAQDHDFWRDLVEDLRTDVDRRNTEIGRLNADIERLNRQRAKDSRTCNAVVNHLRGIVDTLQAVVLDEVAKEAAKAGVQDAIEELRRLPPPPD